MAVLHYTAAPAGVWLVTAVLALAAFIFLVGYLFILYPEPVRGRALSRPTKQRLDTIEALEGRDGAAAHDQPLIDANSAEASIANDVSRFLQRMIGPGIAAADALDSAKLRPFRAVGFLFVTLPTSYIRYRRKMAEESLSGAST